MEVNYRFQKEIRERGQITAGAFGDACQVFITVSVMGWLMIWNIAGKICQKTIRIDIGHVEPCEDIVIVQKRDIVLLNYPKSNRLLKFEVHGLHDSCEGLKTVEIQESTENSLTMWK